MSVAAYKKTIRDVESPREIERRVLSQITFELEKFSASFDQTSSKQERLEILNNGLSHALSENLRLWSTLKHDLAAQENQLPPDLRASLITLALWVERQTSSILAAQASVEPLVAVNRSICAGLSAPVPATEPA